jgi:hypothetical protein
MSHIDPAALDFPPRLQVSLDLMVHRALSHIFHWNRHRSESEYWSRTTETTEWADSGLSSLIVDDGFPQFLSGTESALHVDRKKISFQDTQRRQADIAPWRFSATGKKFMCLRRNK